MHSDVMRHSFSGVPFRLTTAIPLWYNLNGIKGNCELLCFYNFSFFERNPKAKKAEKMKKLLALLIALMTVLLCSCSSGGETIRFGAAGTGGIYNEAANSIKSIADADGTLKIETKTTAGSAANVRLLSQNYLDAAIVQSDIAHDAFNGENNFEKSGSLEGYSAVVGMFTEACHIVVRKDSDINSVDDLLGKTVSIGEEESGSELNAKQILSAYGLNSKMVKEKNLNYADAAKQLENGEIDAAFFTLGLNATVVEELSKQCDIKLIGIDDAAVKKLKNTYSYVDCKIPKNTYNGQSDEVGTVAVKAVLIVNDRLSDEQVKKLTQLVFDNAQELQLTVSADVDITLEKAVEGVKIPFHKGAAEYYSERGITVKTAG